MRAAVRGGVAGGRLLAAGGGGGAAISVSRTLARRGLAACGAMTGSKGGSKGRRVGLGLREQSTCQPGEKVLHMKNVNEKLIKMEYAVRGPLLLRALEIEKELKKGASKPFTEVIKANIGDSHAMGGRPITFLRQVLALTVMPELLEDPRFPCDVKERAKTILEGCKGFSVGSYTESPGIEVIRKHAANYIQDRDCGIPSDYKNIILANGASDAIKSFLRLFVGSPNGKPTGIMIPIPQYPLYSALLSEFGLEQCKYYLDEDKNWSLDICELERAYEESKETCDLRCIVVINPGNPTGQVLTRENIEEIIKFALEKKLFILADEVYQDNIYCQNSCFHSFKKVTQEMGEPYSSMEIASFMSVSKGYMGECGLRGGYVEIMNMDPDVMAILQKSISAMLCPTVIGQAAMDVVVNPPKPGEPSYEQFNSEKICVLTSLGDRSRLVVEKLNEIPGYTTNPAMGAMYVFPRIDIPEKAIEEAKSKNLQPDAFYAFKLLEATGICVIPGSGFGQKPGTYHFRTTILPQVDVIEKMLGLIKDFHVKFIEEYQ